MSRVSVVRRLLTSHLLFASMGWLALGGNARTADAQTTTGSIRGYVKGEGGVAIADAQISVRNQAMGLTRGAMTNASGFYNIPGLRPATYEVSVRRLGFTAQSRTVDVGIGQSVTVDIQLPAAATQLSAVVITTEAAAQSKTSEVGTNISREQIQNLPSADRNFLDLTKLVPGITPQPVNNTDKFFAAGGQSPERVNVFIDGATYKNDVLRGGVAGQDASKGNPFPQAAVQEFRVLTQNYKAEYQKASSAIITATTRSGANQWQGDVFAHGIGKSYVARDAIAVQRGEARPNFKRLQGGGSLGGPIVRDKLFFFGTYELNARDEPATIRLGGDSASLPASLSNLRQFTGPATSEFREHLGFGKLTWAQSDRSTVDASLNIRTENDFRGFGGTTSFQSAEDVAIKVYTGVVNWKYASNQWLNEAQINAQNFEWNPRPKNPGVVGRDYFGLLRIGGRDTKQQFTQNRISLRNDITRSGMQLGGDHVFKGGASIDFLSYEAIKDFNGNPVFRFRKEDNWARPFEAAFGFGDPSINTDNQQIGFYIQDDWAVTPRLLLNLGLRWDVETNMINNDYVTPQPLRDSLTGPLASQFFVEVPTLKADGTCCGTPIRRRVIDELGGINRYITSGSSDRPAYKKAWQPRLGASYDISGKGNTVLFGGYGIYYDRNYWNTLLDEQFRRQFKVLTVAFRDACPAGSPPNCAVWDPKYFDPAQLRTLAGSAGRPEVFLIANDLKPPRSHQFSAGVRQTLGEALVTLSYNGIRGKNGMNFIRATPWGGLGPNYAQAFIADDRVKTWYDAAQLQVERPLRLSTKWGGSLAYTLARAQEQGQSTDIFWPFDDRFPTVGDLPRRRAPGDQRHTIVANAIVRLPYDILFGSIVNLGSGIAVNATDASQGWDLPKQRTYVFVPPTKPFLGIGHVFATQNLDLRLEKGFALGSGQSVSVMADLFNALNSANFGCFEATIVPLPDQNADWRKRYGSPSCAAFGRRLQVGLRYGLQRLGMRSQSQ
ncbi:MAG TPA: TonB-dependent receptor [Gemmatimonadaceae bacterium]|nr:TonB-dependent receptor [Gemmatimonadaceae bacterium]